MNRRDEVWHYLWDAWDRLRTVTTPDGQTFEYTYDPSGRRLSKTGDSASVVFAWHGTQLVEQATAGGEVVSWSYLPGRFTPSTQTHSSTAGSELRAGELLLDSPAAAASQAEVDRRFYALVTDHIDTPAALLNPDTGALVGRAHATMWGQTVWTGEADTPWRFPGQYHDAETGLHYNHHRFYQPGTGRYLSPDPLGLAPAPNPYAYVGNPTMFADPLGLMPYEGGTVWDRITPTQPPYPGTLLPQSFVMHTPHGDMWVHPNATDHLYDEARNLLERGAPHDRVDGGQRSDSARTDSPAYSGPIGGSVRRSQFGH